MEAGEQGVEGCSVSVGRDAGKALKGKDGTGDRLCGM